MGLKLQIVARARQTSAVLAAREFGVYERLVRRWISNEPRLTAARLVDTPELLLAVNMRKCYAQAGRRHSQRLQQVPRRRYAVHELELLQWVRTERAALRAVPRQRLEVQWALIHGSPPNKKFVVAFLRCPSCPTSLSQHVLCG